MPLAGGTQGAVQLDLDTRHAGQIPGFTQFMDKHARGPHRADGVRAGRPDTDPEKVEYTDCHGG
jgi:hypothetical protein